MAPLAPSNTSRYKIFYTNVGIKHQFEVRVGSVSPSALGIYVDNFFTALAGTIFLTTIDEVQFAPSGSDIFNSVSSGIESNTYSSGAGAPTDAANFVGFVGRTSGGRRSRLFIYGTTVNGSVDYRSSAGESAAIDAAIAVLVAPSDAFLAIDGLKPLWKSYANLGVSAHWQKALRQ